MNVKINTVTSGLSHFPPNVSKSMTYNVLFDALCNFATKPIMASENLAIEVCDNSSRVFEVLYLLIKRRTLPMRDITFTLTLLTPW